MRRYSRSGFAFLAAGAAALVFPAAMMASPAGALSAGSCIETGTETNTAYPLPGDPTLVTPQYTSTASLSGCSGLGVTGGTVTFTGSASSPENCDTLNAGVNDPLVGSTVYTWNTGQTSTDNGLPGGHGQVTSGLFQGATRNATATSLTPSPGFCVTTGILTATFTATVTFILPTGSTACANGQSCNDTSTAAATATAPGLSAKVTGTPVGGAGTVDLTIASGKFACPTVSAAAVPVANLTDTGFKTTDKLSVTATLPVASSTRAEQVCFNSNVPFKSQSSPTVATAGTALLLNCAQVANVAPCVQSSTQVGSNVVVKFVVPGGDPRFSIVLPKGRQLWASHFAAGKRGKTYTAQLQSSGGIGAVSWTIASGKLPAGCALNPRTGAITGKPTAKGSFPVVVQATDSEKPPQTAKITVPITVA